MENNLPFNILPTSDTGSARVFHPDYSFYEYIITVPRGVFFFLRGWAREGPRSWSLPELYI